MNSNNLNKINLLKQIKSKHKKTTDRIKIYKIAQKEFLNAIKKGNIEMVKVLLDNYEVSASTNNCQALLIAIKKEHTDIVDLLLKIKFVNPNFMTGEGLNFVAQSGNVEIVKLLLNHPEILPSANGNLPIYYAYENDNVELMTLLFKEESVATMLEIRDISFYNKVQAKIIQNKVSEF